MCALNYFLGMDCPGCGLTRSLFSLLSGRLTESILLHPMGLVFFLWGANFWWWRKIKFSQTSRRMMSVAILAGFFISWFLNILGGYYVPKF